MQSIDTTRLRDRLSMVMINCQSPEDSAMLMNFCRKCLETSVTCSAVSNDGYEVTNLISDSENGFLAYSCIKPPIHIDFTFVCEIQVSRVLIWPSVGAQKSSGFELSVCSGSSPEYRRVSAGFLDSEHSGLVFYRRDLPESSLEAPAGFLQRYIQISDGVSVNRAKMLRLSILRTQNSVPAIGRVEVWGRVSRSCSKETIARVHSLWRNNVLRVTNFEERIEQSSLTNVAESSRDSSDDGFTVPDSFLDPITWNIMIQPIVLPSGATIDQSTLERHAKSEATWGRALSDPFTGVPFTDSRKPVLASALKARIDKFLLENKSAPDVRSMPRLSGHKRVLMSLRNRSLELSEITSDTVPARHSSAPQSTKSLCEKSSNRISLDSTKSPISVAHSRIARETRVHKLPVVPIFSKRAIVKKKSRLASAKKIANSAIRTESDDVEEVLIVSKPQSNLERSVQTVLSNLRRFGEDNRVDERDCLENCGCVSRVFYKLPCNHVVCRDTLKSVENSLCPICRCRYDSGDPERVHRHS